MEEGLGGVKVWSCVSDVAVAGTLTRETVGVGRGGFGFAEVMNDNMVQHGKAKEGQALGSNVAESVNGSEEWRSAC